MKYKGFIFLVTLFLIFSCVSDKKDNITTDKNLIIPGKSAEGFTLGDTILKNNTMNEFEKDKNISEILDIDILSDLQFDSVLYMKDSFALFLRNSKVVVIAGFNQSKRVTSDAVLLSKGVDSFIINYGNNGLSIITRGSHKVYIYKKSGIAVCDDNNDNTIDMYLVFKPQ